MKSVLIAEDDAMVRDAILAALKRMPDKVRLITAANGAEALEILRRETVDLLITDLQMPEMDGLALLAHTAAELRDLPCIVITGYARNLHQFQLMVKALEPAVQKALEESKFRFFTKPFDIKALMEAAAGLLGNTKTGLLRGISMEGFIQLLEIEGKTCRVDITAACGGRGMMFFYQGKLCDAQFRDRHGEEAALALLGLSDPEITFQEIDDKTFDIPCSIKTSAIALLMEAARIRDEGRGNER